MDMNAIIHTLITLVGIGLVFYYFRNRLAATEQKVDLMFQLIQEHEKNSTNRQQFHMPIIQSDPGPNVEKKNLISVSDDDSDESCSEDDSDEVSDDDKLTYGETLIHGSTLGTEKIITLELNGDVNSVGIPQEPYINNIVILNNTDQESGEDQESNANQESDATQESDVDQESEGVESEGVESEGVEILLTEPKLNYKKATVAQLKELCETKNLTGFRTMRKQALIELLEK